MYKTLSRLAVRFQTVKGPLTIEQLWTLDTKSLNSLVLSLEEEYNASKGKSYLRIKTKKDKTLKLMFDVALDILNTKLDEEEANTNASEVKIEEQKLLSLLKYKEDEELKSLTKEEIEAKLKALKKK